MTSGLEYALSGVAAWRACLALVADVLVMPLQAHAQGPAEVNVSSVSLCEDLCVLMYTWVEECSSTTVATHKEDSLLMRTTYCCALIGNHLCA